MKRLILAFSGLAILSGCSDRGRAPVTEKSTQEIELTLPDTGLARDTSLVLSSRAEQPVSPVEQPVARAEEKPAKKAGTAPTRRKRPAPPAPSTEDTLTRAYAPNPAPDSAPVADTTTAASSAQPRDTAARIADTAGPPARDTVRTADTVTSPAADTLAARTPDTTPTTVADTTVATGGTELPLASAGARESTARTLPVGTEIHAALEDSISSRRDTVGHIIAAHIMQNVTGPDGRTLIAAGTPVRFTVTQLRSAKSKGSQGRLALRVDGIALNGQLRPVQADVRPVPRELRGRGVTAGDAAKVGGGAVGGAVIGRVLGGSTRGAVIGGVVGAAGGAVVASQTATRDVVVKAKTPVVFVLTAPLVTP